MTDDELIVEFGKLFFDEWAKAPRKWMGHRIVKYPTDLFLYQMLIAGTRPEVIIETGTYVGGSAMFLASMCDMRGAGEVISIDIKARTLPQHPRVTYLVGRSTAVDTLAKVKELVAGRSCMVILDSDHHRWHVKRELAYYSRFVTKGHYLIVEDTYRPWIPKLACPHEAVLWFLERHKDFERVPVEDRFLKLSLNIGGYLRRIA
jgi:cephalosporin hydroxylase